VKPKTNRLQDIWTAFRIAGNSQRTWADTYEVWVWEYEKLRNPFDPNAPLTWGQIMWGKIAKGLASSPYISILGPQAWTPPRVGGIQILLEPKQK